MSEKYDVIVVGARCAGSPTAMLLARKGYRVLLVDKATFPSDAISTHFVLHGGLKLMDKWGLLDRLLATDCPPITHFINYMGDFALSGTLEFQNGVPPGMAPRRFVLDQILVEAAVEAGAELREGFAVREILMDGERVTGIRGGEKGGPAVDVHAPLVIGSDGKHSLLARTVGAQTYHDLPTLAFYYYSYWEGLDMRGSEVYWQPGRITACWPTHDGRVLVSMGWPIDLYPDFKQDVEGSYRRTLEGMPGLGERLREAAMVERLVGMADLPNFFRQSYGDGWALVGDAGYFKDPVRGHGINDAFHAADIVTGKINEAFSGHKPLQDALAEYQAERDDLMIAEYQVNARAATLRDWDTPHVLALRQAIKDNPEALAAYGGAQVGTIAHKDFFNRENIERLIREGTG